MRSALVLSKVDLAYAGLDAVLDVLSEVKARLVAAEEDGVDKAKIQSELDQLKEQVRNIATSSSFSGVNWLNTEIADIYDKTLNRAGVVSSFVRVAEAAWASRKWMSIFPRSHSLTTLAGDCFRPIPVTSARWEAFAFPSLPTAR
ncbi:hypothetical protein [Sinorhizobium meliloti]